MALVCLAALPLCGLPARAAPTPAPAAVPGPSGASWSPSFTQPTIPNAVDPVNGHLPIGEISSIAPSDTGSALHDFARNAILWIGGDPLLHPGAEIDRDVGDPWTLNPSTAAKIDLLPSKLRLALFSALASRTPDFETVPSASNAGDFSNMARAPQIMMPPEQAAQLLNDLASRLGNYFTPGELLDLGVFALSKTSFFPKTHSEWEQVKNAIVANGAPLAVGALLAELAAGNISVNITGSIIKLDGDKYRIGWYGSVQGLGFDFRPAVRAGLTASTSALEGSVGVAEFVNALPGNQRTAVEAFVREHLLTPALQGTGWNAGAWVNARVVADSGNPAEIGHVFTDFSYFVSKDAYMENSVIAFLVNGTLTTDFQRMTAARISVGLEDPGLGTALGLSASRVDDPVHPGATGYQFGLSFGGNFESNETIAESHMLSDRLRVEDRISPVTHEKENHEAILARLKDFGTGVLRPDQENELIYQLRKSEDRLFQARVALAAAMKDYLFSRGKYFVLHSHRPRTELTEDDGPLPAETFEKVLAELGSPPRYVTREHEEKREMRIVPREYN